MRNKYCEVQEGVLKTTIPNTDSRIVYIEVTGKCNLNCKHCFNNSGDTGEDLEWNYITRVYDELEMFEVKQVIISGGEVFTRKDIFEILQLFRQKYDVKVLTNGMLLSDHDIEKLIALGVHIQITLNGSCERIDSRTRNIGFDKTVRTIKKVIASGGKEELTVTNAISKKNQTDIEKYMELMDDIGVGAVQFTFVYDKGRASDKWDEWCLSLPDKIRILEKIFELKEKYKKILIRTSGMKPSNPYLVDEDFSDCRYLTEEVSFFSTGEVMLCPNLKHYQECLRMNAKIYKKEGLSSLETRYMHDSKCDFCVEKHVCAIGCVERGFCND